MVRGFRGSALAVVALYALAMSLLGFSHQPLPGALVAAPDAVAFVLPDGSLPPICGHDGQNIPDGGQVVQHCDACALSAAPGLPPVAAICVPTPVSRTVRLGMAVAGQFAPAALPAPTSRGPPLS